MNERKIQLDPSADAPLHELLPGARRIVENAAGIRAGENVIVVTDYHRPLDVSAALIHAIRERGALPISILIDPVNSGSEPPQPVSAAFTEADVIIAPTTGTLYHTQAVLTATQAGARFLALTGFTKDVLVRGGVFANFSKIEPQVQWLVERLTNATVATITAPGGTQLTARLDQRAAVPITGSARNPGERSACPDIEAFIAPLETSTNGVVVVDASAPLIGVVSQPLQITIREGKAVRIDGDGSSQIWNHLERTGTSSAYTLAEIAFGLNPNGLIRGVIVEDEGVAGTGHVALGSNIHFGGKSDAPIHLDFVYKRPTLKLDGETVIADGELCMDLGSNA